MYEQLDHLADKLTTISKMQVRMIRKYADEGEQLLDEVAERRKYRKLAVQLLILCKMSARLANKQQESAILVKRQCERQRRIRNDNKLFTEEYENADMLLKLCREAGRQNAKQLVMYDDLFKKQNLTLTRDDLQVALSISDVDWNTHADNKRDIMYLVFLARIGDEALADQLTEYMRYQIMANDTLRAVTAAKARQLFPQIFGY